MKFDFMESIAKIVAEVRTRTCIDRFDIEVIKAILHEQLVKYHNEVFTYGHSIGYEDGYIAGTSILEGDVDNAYNEGCTLSYDDGYDDGRAYGYTAGHSDGYALGYDDGYYDGRYEGNS